MANELRKSIQDVLMQAGRGYHLNLNMIKELEERVIKTNPDEEIFEVSKIKLVDSCIVKSSFIASISIKYDDKSGAGYGLSTPAFLMVRNDDIHLTLELPFPSDSEVSIEDMLISMVENLRF
jgi:hypothetical protein